MVLLISVVVPSFAFSAFKIHKYFLYTIILSNFFSWKERASGSSVNERDTRAKQNLRQFYALLLDAVSLNFLFQKLEQYRKQP